MANNKHGITRRTSMDKTNECEWVYCLYSRIKSHSILLLYVLRQTTKWKAHKMCVILFTAGNYWSNVKCTHAWIWTQRQIQLFVHCLELCFGVSFLRANMNIQNKLTPILFPWATYASVDMVLNTFCFQSGLFFDSRISTGKNLEGEKSVPLNGIIQAENYYEPRDPPGDPNGKRVWTSLDRYVSHKQTPFFWSLRNDAINVQLHTGWHYLLNFSFYTTFKAELKTFLFSQYFRPN